MFSAPEWTTNFEACYSSYALCRSVCPPVEYTHQLNQSCCELAATSEANDVVFVADVLHRCPNRGCLRHSAKSEKQSRAYINKTNAKKKNACLYNNMLLRHSTIHATKTFVTPNHRSQLSHNLTRSFARPPVRSLAHSFGMSVAQSVAHSLTDRQTYTCCLFC